jgi:hypothetical protein
VVLIVSRSEKEMKNYQQRKELKYSECGEFDLSVNANESSRRLQRIRRLSDRNFSKLDINNITGPHPNASSKESFPQSTTNHIDYFQGSCLPKLVVRSVATGATMTLLSTSDGRCFQFGTFAKKLIPPSEILMSKTVVQISIGWGCLKADIFVTGELPRKSQQNKDSLSDEDHLCALTTESKRNLYTWGGNRHGQLGHGHRKFGENPEAVPFSLDHERIAHVSAGYKFTVAVSEGNHVFSWGCNDVGQLGNATFEEPEENTTNNKETPVSEFINPNGKTDITSPILLKQLEHGYANQGPFSSSVFQEEETFNGDEATSSYYKRHRLVATGINHSMLWNTLSPLPTGTSKILNQREIDMIDLETASDMLQDRILELSILRSLDDDIGGVSEDDDEEYSEDDGEVEEGGNDMNGVKKTKGKMGDNQNQNTECQIDPRVREKKILMTLFSTASQDGSPAAPEVLHRLNQDALLNSVVNCLSSLEEQIQSSKHQIYLVKGNAKKGKNEMMNVSSRATNTLKNVGALQDFIENVPGVRGKNKNELDEKIKGMIDDVADDSSQLVLSDRTILRQIEKDKDRLSQQHVLLAHQLTVQKETLSKLEEEYRSLLHIAASRTKIVINQGVNHGVDAFDAATSLERMSVQLSNAQPANMMQLLWESLGALNTRTSTNEIISNENVEDSVSSTIVDVDRNTLSYTKMAEKSQRTSAQLLDILRSQINSSKFVHEFGIPTSDPSLQQLKDALANTTSQGQPTHTIGRASVNVGGTSASHELLKWGSIILADTNNIDQETEKIIQSLIHS